MRPPEKKIPDFSYEREAKCAVGIDEVGRGAWAGPVLACALLWRVPPEESLGVVDSKTLSAAQREALEHTLHTRCNFAFGCASAPEIDRLNILQATLLAMKRAFLALRICPDPALPDLVLPDLALIDGIHAPDLPCETRTIKGGDGRSLSIAAASILAKLTRDRLMKQADALWPGYGWAHNAGYGTPFHRRALVEKGVTMLHRHSFRPISAALSPSENRKKSPKC